MLVFALRDEGWEVFEAIDGLDALRVYHDAIAGYQIITTTQGARELRICDPRSFDVIVIDVEMPRLRGFAVGVNVRNVEKFGTVPRADHVYFTGYDDVVPPEQLLETSFADGYLRKPIDSAELIAEIEKLVSKEAAGAP